MEFNGRLGFPRQKVSSREKTLEWRKASVKAIINSVSQSAASRTSREEKQVNYNLINSIIDESDFEKQLDPFGIGDEFGGAPADMEVYNIVRPKIELLKGEEANRPFKWYVRGVSGEVVNIKTEESRKLLLQYLQARYQSVLGMPAQENAMEPAQIQKYMNTEFLDPREVTANQILRFLTRYDNLQSKFNQGWEHGLIAAEEIYYLGIKDGHPSARVVDPRYFGFDKDSDAEYIEDSNYAWEERNLSINTIIDLYGEDLSDDDIERLESGSFNASLSHHVNQLPGQVYDAPTYPFDGAGGMQNFAGGIPVYTVAWRSLEKVGFLTYFDEEVQQEVTTMVDDSFKMTSDLKAAGATVRWQWKTQIWEGVCIAGDIFPYIRPLRYQIGKLPYVGHLYNATGSRATSLLDLMKPHQYAYLTIWWKILGEIAKAGGSKMVMDMAQIPKSKGISTEQWIYYWDKLNIAWINSMEETPDRKEKSQFNQFRNIEMGVSQQFINSLIMLLNELKNEIAMLTGVTPQREAQTQASESATGVNTAVVQSSHITEPLFRKHSEVKRNVYTMLLEIAKVAYEDGKMIQYVVDDAYYLQLKIDGNTFPDSHYGVFVVDGSRDFVAKQKLEQLANVALQQQTVRFSDIAKLITTDSVSEFQTYLVNAENRREAQQAEMQKAQQESAERIEASRRQGEAEKMANENEQKQLDREASLREATIKALGSKEGPVDMNQNGIPDPIEEMEIGIKMMQHQQDVIDKQEKRTIEQQKEAQKAQLEREKGERESEKIRADIKRSEIEGRFKQVDMNLRNKQLQQDKQLADREQAQQDRKNAADIAIKKAELQIKMKELADKEKDRALKLKEMAHKEKELKMKERIEKFKVKNKPKPAAKK